MPNPFVYHLMVEFADTDMAGIVHFANFFRWMERAEHAFLRSIGLSVSMNLEGVVYGLPRVHAECDYLRPLRFEEQVEIEVRVSKLSNRSATFTFSIRKSGGEEGPNAKGIITAACVVKDSVTGTYRAVHWPEKVREALIPHLSE